MAVDDLLIFSKKKNVIKVKQIDCIRYTVISMIIENFSFLIKFDFYIINI